MMLFLLLVYIYYLHLHSNLNALKMVLESCSQNMLYPGQKSHERMKEIHVVKRSKNMA